MTAKEIVAYFKRVFALDSINYPLQMRNANALLKKYTSLEIKYAIDYYKEKGQEVFSLGWLLYRDNMKYPVSQYHAEINTQGGEDSGERNKQRVEQYSKAKCRKNDIGYLFEETREDN